VQLLQCKQREPAAAARCLHHGVVVERQGGAQQGARVLTAHGQHLQHLALELAAQSAQRVGDRARELDVLGSHRGDHEDALVLLCLVNAQEAVHHRLRGVVEVVQKEQQRAPVGDLADREARHLPAHRGRVQREADARRPELRFGPRRGRAQPFGGAGDPGAQLRVALGGAPASEQ
jgi:hypothetical protein